MSNTDQLPRTPPAPQLDDAMPAPPAATPVGPVARRLFPYRYVFLSLYGLAWAVGFVLFVIWRPDAEAVLLVAAVVAVVLLLQAAFLWGAPHWRWPRANKRRPMIVSLAAGSLVAALLTVGVALALVSLAGADMDAVAKLGPLMIVVPICAWGGWLAVFAVLWAGAPVVGFRRIYTVLFAGTWLELLITVPVDAQVRKRTTCYCNEGSFFAMAIGISAAVWAFGPGLVLLFLARRVQRRADLRMCVGCGYDLRGLTEPRCPECGLPFDPRLLAKPAEVTVPAAPAAPPPAVAVAGTQPAAERAL